MRSAVAAMGIASASLAAPSLAAQAVDSAGPRGAFIGRVLSSVDSSPAKGVEIRLFSIDSVTKGTGPDSLYIFVDSLTTRLAVTDSVGAFAIRRLQAGRYLLCLRRIGFSPTEGALIVGTDTVRADLTMAVVSQMLAQMTIKETSTDVVKRRLDRVDFITRSHEGISGTFLDRKDILRRHREALGELL